ncbi:serine hydrolase domain-containing protein [Hyphococcus sp.]|uniref:serine hydrolase domain-containing protein n=3 Tax=Hyphococcus sp. TaxID=2038636 RepID=UPI0035C69F63
MRFAVFSLILLFVAACESAPKPELPSSADITAETRRLMQREDVKGLALAVVTAGEVRDVMSFGYRNVERKEPLETDTIMYGASLTKAAFAYMVLQLVDEGLVDLDRPIADYLDRPIPDYEGWAVLEGDEDWRRVTPRHVLTHTTGLHNLRFLEPNRDLKFHFTPGDAYAYSGEGFWLLQLMLEEGLGLDVKEEMQRRMFDRFDMPNTSMQWREDFADNLADGYAMDGSFEPHDERSNVAASGSMDTTIADQAKMWRGMLAGEGLSAASRAEWVRPQFPIRTAQKFPTIENYDTSDPRGEPINLSAGLGVETWDGPQGRAFAKGGHNPWTGNIVICQEVEERCLVLLGNSVRAEIIYPEIVEFVLGETDYPWWWTYPALHDPE